MGNGRLLIWTIQGIIALCQGRILYLYSLTGTRNDIRRTILTIALLYASAAFSMSVLLLVFHGKRDIRITRHAFWTTVIFPVIATVTADFLYIKVSGRFFLGLFFLLFAAVIYVVAGLGLSMLCIRIFGHSAFRPFTYGNRIPVRSRYARHGSIGSNYSGTRDYRDIKFGARNDRDREFREREYKDNDYKDRDYRDRKNNGQDYNDRGNIHWEYNNKEYKNKEYNNKENYSSGYSDKEYSDKEYSDKEYSDKGYSDKGYSDRRYSNKEHGDRKYRDRVYSNTEFTGWGTGNAEQGTRNASGSTPIQKSEPTEQPRKSTVIIPDYSQEYIDKIDRDYIDKLEQPEEDSLTLLHPNDRPVYYGGSKSRTMVAYVTRDNQFISCNERRTGYGRLGRIASSGEIYEYNGGVEAYAGVVTAAGYIRNSAGLDIGCVDEDGNVFRYEGDGALDMTHAKTLVGKVTPGDYAAGAAFLLLM